MVNRYYLLSGVALLVGLAASASYAGGIQCPANGLKISCDEQKGCVFSASGKNTLTSGGVTWLLAPEAPYPASGLTTLKFMQASYWPNRDPSGPSAYTGCMYSVDASSGQLGRGNRITLTKAEGAGLEPDGGHWRPTKFAPAPNKGCTDIETCTFKLS